MLNFWPLWRIFVNVLILKVKKKTCFREFQQIYHETLLFTIFLWNSQLSAVYYLAGFQHQIYKANASFSMLILSKGRLWGLNIRVQIDLENLLSSDSRRFTNLYCNWYLTPVSHSAVCVHKSRWHFFRISTPPFPMSAFFHYYPRKNWPIFVFGRILS